MRGFRWRARGDGGYTLVELMVVIAITAIIFGIGFYGFFAARQTASLQAAQEILIDATREARNRALTPRAGTGTIPRVYTLFLRRQSPAGTTADLRFYIPCAGPGLPPSCSSTAESYLPPLTEIFSPGATTIEDLFFDANNNGIRDGGEASLSSAYLHFSVPFGKLCITEAPPSNVAREINVTYPVNYYSVPAGQPNPEQYVLVNYCRHAVLPPALTDNSFLVAVLRRPGTSFVQKVKIHDYSGDASLR